MCSPGSPTPPFDQRLEDRSIAAHDREMQDWEKMHSSELSHAGVEHCGRSGRVAHRPLRVRIRSDAHLQESDRQSPVPKVCRRLRAGFSPTGNLRSERRLPSQRRLGLYGLYVGQVDKRIDSDRAGVLSSATLLAAASALSDPTGGGHSPQDDAGDQQQKCKIRQQSYQ